MITEDNPKALVLMVDDSDDDGTLLELAFQKLERFQLAGRVSDGHQAIAWLKGEGTYANRDQYPIPNVILLDLRMPNIDGFDVLKWIRSQSFPDLQIVVFSGSESGDDAEKALQMGAHFYRRKPLRFKEQISMLKSLELHVAGVPPIQVSQRPASGI